MFALLYGLYDALTHVPTYNVLFLGPQGTGKTAVVARLRGETGALAPAAPTVGLNTAIVSVAGAQWTLWDVGGAPRLQRLWPSYYADADAIIVVVEAKAEVRTLLQSILDGMRAKRRDANWPLAVPILILVNKTDQLADSTLPFADGAQPGTADDIFQRDVVILPTHASPNLEKMIDTAALDRRDSGSDSSVVFTTQPGPVPGARPQVEAPEPALSAEDALAAIKDQVNAVADDAGIALLRVAPCSAADNTGVHDAFAWLQRAVISTRMQ